MNGISMPAIEECPECGGDRLGATENVLQGATLVLDGNGGIATNSTESLMGVTYISIECRNCETVLVEDGEVVHDEVDA